MIPKIIHCVWVGHNPKTKLFEKCLESWKKFCPNYEIKIWDEDKFDINKYKHCSEAYKYKKYGFVPDTLRFYALYNFGGIYLDADMELIKPIDDLLDNKMFSGFEDKEYVSCGIIGAEKHNKHCKAMFELYKNKSFILKDGTLNLKETGPSCLTHYLNKKGLKANGDMQLVDGFKIYPIDYFYPMNNATGIIKITDNSYAVHHWAGSWLDKKTLRTKKIRMFFARHLRLKKIAKSILSPFRHKKCNS